MRRIVGAHFSLYHPLSLYRTECVICKQSISCTSTLKPHLKRKHADLFPAAVLADQSAWHGVYAEELRKGLVQRGFKSGPFWANQLGKSSNN